MFTSIAGRVAIVTGASRGIGRGIARVFAQQGAKVLLAARGLAEAEAAAQAITEAGGTASAIACNVADPAAARALAVEAERLYGGIDILCANAGIFTAAALAEMTPEQWDDVVDINLKGTFLTVSACLPALKRSGRGRIILTSSITGPITGMPGWSHYGASKAGQVGFMRSAAIELASFGVTVNSVLPGNILTEGLQGVGEDYMRSMVASIPMRRLGTVEDIANAALFLASDEAGFITGQTLVVDGGQVLPESLAAMQ